MIIYIFYIIYNDYMLVESAAGCIHSTACQEDKLKICSFKKKKIIAYLMQFVTSLCIQIKINDDWCCF